MIQGLHVFIFQKIQSAEDETGNLVRVFNFFLLWSCSRNTFLDNQKVKNTLLFAQGFNNKQRYTSAEETERDKIYFDIESTQL